MHAARTGNGEGLFDLPRDRRAACPAEPPAPQGGPAASCGAADHAKGGRELVAQLETHLDHLNGEDMGLALEALSHMPEVLDVLWLPGVGKKNRPAGLLRVLCLPPDRERVAQAVLRHTHTLGLRWSLMERIVLPRSSCQWPVAGENLPAKAYALEGLTFVRPEADALAQAARRRGVGVPALRHWQAAGKDAGSAPSPGGVGQAEDRGNALLSGLARYLSPAQMRTLRHARVGIAGAGGLGSNAAVMLARCGVGHLLLVDDDIVEASNLNRQQFWPRHVGMPKVEALAELLREINPSLCLDMRRLRLAPANVDAVLAACPIWVEALDGPADKAMLVERALVSGCRVAAASGLAGWGGPDMMRRRRGRLTLVGDFTSDISSAPPLAPRVTEAAALLADAVLEMLLGNGRAT